MARIGSREFCYDALGRRIGGTGFSRTLDCFGNVVKETFATGLAVETTFDASDRPLLRTLPDQSHILYTYEGPFLREVRRIDPTGRVLYAHTYDEFDPDGQVLSETGAFMTRFGYDQLGRQVLQTTPWFTEELEYDPSGNLIRKGTNFYTYDNANQLIASEREFAHQYDSHYNRILPAQDELPYDANGNLTFPGFVFDEFDQLVQANGEPILYDALGRRLQKGETSYLYIGNEEVGSFENGKPKEFYIPGVAVEIDNTPYFSITDVQGMIRGLVDPATSQIVQENQCDPFGVGLSAAIPYAYVGKRYDPQTGLVYFGKRYYVPSLGQWLTPDPLGPIDHSNLYQYVFNNPFRYQDPMGESVGGWLLGMGEIILGGTIMAGGFALEVVTLGGFTFGVGVTTSTGAALIGLGLATTTYHAQDMKIPSISWKNIDIYVPDRPLPLTENGIPVPEINAPHTELGTRDGSKGKYPQAREFDKNGQPVRDIDFTDHGYPKNHPNPHQHRPSPNATGGTPQRGKPEPVPEWRY